MIRLKIEGEIREYEENTTLQEAAAGFQDRFACDILLAMVDGRLCELARPAEAGTEVSFLTAKDAPGMETYRRSVLLLMLKSIYDVVGESRIERVTVEFSVGNGIFIDPRGDFSVDGSFLDRLRTRMLDLVQARLPIGKKNVRTDDAIRQFHMHRMFDKERLFSFRRVSRVNLYSLDGFEDYYYGYMVPDTGFLRWFGLSLCPGGFMLLLPDRTDPCHVAPYREKKKLFSVLAEAEETGKRLGIETVGALNVRISEGRINELILVQEALMEKKIGDIAEQIASRPDRNFVMIAGPSSSGKTTFSHRLSTQLRTKGLVPHPIAVDNYFLNRADSPRDADGNYDFESLACIDVAGFNRDMNALLAGETVALPTYNFLTGEREYRGNTLKLGGGDILVIEGIHCLNEALSSSLPAANKFKIYISALSQLNIDEHNRIPTTDGRLLRRIVRDARTRGSSAQDTIRMWPSVRRGEEGNIFPYQEEADVMFNSALIYELAVLKQYVEPLLFSVPRRSPEYIEAKRLLKFLDYFLGVGSENIPHNSIIREFIGGSCFSV